MTREDEQPYRINDIFYSIQGEGAHTGRPMVFVRFSGCNMSCSFCDTKHQSFALMEKTEIANDVRNARNGGFLEFVIDTPICLTGGEPMIQLDKELVDHLRRMNELHVETNGTVWNFDVLEAVSHLTVSPKQSVAKIEVVHGENYVIPQGRIEARRLISNMLVDTGTECELKIVWTTRDEMLSLMGLIAEWSEHIPWIRKSIQPCYLPDGSVVDKGGFLEFILRNPEWHLSCQVQKYLNFS